MWRDVSTENSVCILTFDPEVNVLEGWGREGGRQQGRGETCTVEKKRGRDGRERATKEQKREREREREREKERERETRRDRQTERQTEPKTEGRERQGEREMGKKRDMQIVVADAILRKTTTKRKIPHSCNQ